MLRSFALTAAALLVTACASDGSSGSDTTVPPHDSTHVAEHETPKLTEMMVTVPGYTFVEIDHAELEVHLDTFHRIEREAEMPDWFEGVSLHAVVADDWSQNVSHTASGQDEVGFLSIVQFPEDAPGDLSAEIARSAVGTDPVDELEVADLPVYVFAQPDLPDSLWVYAWVYDGVLFSIDGAQRQPIERWLEAYLPLLTA